MIVVSACDEHWDYIFAVLYYGGDGAHLEVVVCLHTGYP